MHLFPHHTAIAADARRRRDERGAAAAARRAAVTDRDPRERARRTLALRSWAS